MAPRHIHFDRPRPRAHISPVADHSAGQNRGRWTELDLGVDHVVEQVGRMLGRSRPSGLETYVIDEVEGLEPYEVSGDESLAQLAELGEGAVLYGRAFTCWASYLGSSNLQRLDDFEHAYQGLWPVVDAFVESQLRDLRSLIEFIERRRGSAGPVLDEVAYAVLLNERLRTVPDGAGVHVFWPSVRGCWASVPVPYLADGR